MCIDGDHNLHQTIDNVPGHTVGMGPCLSWISGQKSQSLLLNPKTKRTNYFRSSQSKGAFFFCHFIFYLALGKNRCRCTVWIYPAAYLLSQFPLSIYELLLLPSVAMEELIYFSAAPKPSWGPKSESFRYSTAVVDGETALIGCLG